MLLTLCHKLFKKFHFTQTHTTITIQLKIKYLKKEIGMFIITLGANAF